ncbi:MAG: hypothetical protein FJ189_07000 [Gammaproteobacteria bacterium]|nr:hypothetical protein [Gammaproteobacteria bacterium]
MTTKTIEVTEPGADTPLRLFATCVGVGADLVVVVGGGERPHIGAAAMAVSIPSIKDPATAAQSSYLASVPGHKEEGLARDGALRLCRALGRTVVVTVGIHDDGISKAGIAGYLALFDRLIDTIAADQQARPSDPGEVCWRCARTEGQAVTGGTGDGADGACWVQPPDGPRVVIGRSGGCLAGTDDEARQCVEEVAFGSALLRTIERQP